MWCEAEVRIPYFQNDNVSQDAFSSSDLVQIHRWVQEQSHLFLSVYHIANNHSKKVIPTASDSNNDWFTSSDHNFRFGIKLTVDQTILGIMGYGYHSFGCASVLNQTIFQVEQWLVLNRTEHIRMLPLS